MRHTLALLILVVGLSFIAVNARAQWQVNGVPICTATDSQYSPQIVSDGSGGAIVTWFDGRGGGPMFYDIYAQRVDAAGNPQWTNGGVPVCTAEDAQADPVVVSDGAGGAIVVWNDGRPATSGIYAQRLNVMGVPQWTADGVRIARGGHPKIVTDGAGGAIVTWEAYRGGASDIYVQRVNASGVPQWTADGDSLLTGGRFPTIVADGAGGAIVTWWDYRSSDVNIYCQRVNAAGVSQWTANGVALCTAVNSQYSSTIASDGAGGAIVTWHDYRSGEPDIYSQRVNAGGATQWMANGVALCTAADEQANPTIVSDAAGGAIVAWEDLRDGNNDIYAQRVSAAGTPQWTADGIALCTQPYYQYHPTLVPDGAGGAIVAWEDPRDGVQFDIYAQRVNASGTQLWAADGVAFCLASNDQRSPAIDSDGAGGAIVTWEDRRSGTRDIYAQHVTDPSNAVAIASFDASQANGVVMLHSAFRSDLGVEAVNVYRAADTHDNQLMVIQRVDDVRSDRFEYVDRDVAPGQSYRYRIGVVDGDGEFFSPIVTVSVKAIAAALSQNQPNPFNPTTTIRFVLPVREDVTLAIYDTNGHLVRTLVDGVQGFGAHEVTWDGRNDNGAAMGSGVYFYRLRAGKITEAKKMVLLK